MNALKSGLISMSGSAVQQGISLLGTIILARLLSPEDYGVYGLCFATFVFFQAFLDFGLTPIYIKMETVNTRVDSAFFAVNLLFGATVTLLLVLIAPFFADYYSIPLLKPLLYTQAIIPLLQSISNQPFGQLLRNQKFIEAEVISVGSSLIAMSTGIFCAFCGLGPWSLLYKHMSFNISRISGGFWYSKAKYHWVQLSDLVEIKRYLTYAGHLTAARLATGISGNLEKLFIGKIFGEVTLGHYNQALFITDKPAIFGNALTTPAMSYLAKMPKDRYASSYITITHLVLFFIGLPCLYLFIYGENITFFILGNSWVLAAQLVTIVSLLGFSLVLKSLCNVFFVNESQTHYLFYSNLLCIILTYIPSVLVLLTSKSLYVFLLVFCSISLVFWVIILLTLLWKSHENKNVDIKDFLYIITLPVTFVLVCFAAKSIFVSLSLPELINILLVGLIALVLVYAVMVSLFKKQVTSQINFIKVRFK